VATWLLHSSRLAKFLESARRPIDSASLAVFRMCFGAIAFWEVCRYFTYDWIAKYWEDPTFHFHYVGFGWVEPLPAPGMHVLWGLLGLAALGIAFGALYRVSAIVFAVGFGYTFLIEAGQYLNHFYFIELLAILLAVTPAHRLWSVDARLRGWEKSLPTPAWALWLIRFQVAVLYVGGGIAKMDGDWLRGEPMGSWLGNSTDFILLGGLFGHPSAGVVAAWGGMLFDLGIVFAVWWRPTRLLALNAAVLFHVINSSIFSIGVFPFLALAALLVFCPPDWPRQLVADLQGRDREPLTYEAPARTTSRLTPVWIGLAALFVAAQVLIPLRHLVMPGKSSWTEGGHTFAWHMKLRDKEGDVTYRIVDPSNGRTMLVSPLDELGEWVYSDLSSRPELIRQYAHHLADRYTHDGVRPRVYALTTMSLNGRQAQVYIDSSVDLAAEKATLGTPDWVMPLVHPLPGH
jgi:hypothetical protein